MILLLNNQVTVNKLIYVVHGGGHKGYNPPAYH